MSRLVIDRDAEYERRIGDLLREYARAADGPIDVFAISSTATATGHPTSAAQRWRAALLLVALLAGLTVLIGAAIVLGTPPRILPVMRFEPDELLVTLTTDGGDITAVSVTSGERRTISPDGIAFSISPDRSRFLRAIWNERFGGALVTDARGHDLARLNSWSVGSAVWSPDNRLILIAGEHGDAQKGDGIPGYAIWDTSSGSVTILPLAPVTRGNEPGPQMSIVYDRVPEWAPNGTSLLLPTDAGLAVAGINGELVTRIDGTSRESVGYWSPDGGHLLVEDRSTGSLVMLAVSQGFETTKVAVVAADSARDPAWAPDGGRLAWVSRDGVVVAGVDAISSSRVVYRETVIEGSGLHWSPQGDRLAFIGWTRNGATHWLSKGIYLLELATGNESVVLSPYRGRIVW